MNTKQTLSAALCGFALISSALAAHACYSGLTIVPTADVLEHREWSIEYQVDGAFSPLTGTTNLLNTQTGVANRLELGIDIDLNRKSETRALLNGKVKLWDDDARGRAVAAGIHNVGAKLTSIPYVVGSAAVGKGRLHAGLQKAEGAWQGFVGADADLTERLTVMADYTPGKPFASSIGANYRITDRVEVMAGAVIPNAGGAKPDTRCILCTAADGEDLTGTRRRTQPAGMVGSLPAC